MSIARTTDNFPPAQVKEKIGLMSVAMAKCTDPSNKISLCSSRISTLVGVLKVKVDTWAEPGLTEVLIKCLTMMVDDMKTESPEEGIRQTLSEIERYLNVIADEQTSKKYKKEVPQLSLDILYDYNIVLQCRERWKDANDIYMANRNAWSISNKIIADIGDKLEEIELKYNLIIMPKSYSYNIDDLTMFKQQPGASDNGQ
jgi:hypothetical protein